MALGESTPEDVRDALLPPTPQHPAGDGGTSLPSLPHALQTWKCPLLAHSQERLPQSKLLPLAGNGISITETKTFSESPWNQDLWPPFPGSHLCPRSLLSVLSQRTEHYQLRNPYPHPRQVCAIHSVCHADGVTEPRTWRKVLLFRHIKWKKVRKENIAGSFSKLTHNQLEGIRELCFTAFCGQLQIWVMPRNQSLPGTFTEAIRGIRHKMLEAGSRMHR